VADVNANIGIHIDTSTSLAEIKNLQRQLASLYTSINRGSAAAAAAQKGLATNLINTINAGGKFYAQMGTIRTSTESFTHALEKNKLSMREYFRYAGGASKTFGRLFKQEFDTIGKVAEDRVRKMQTQYIKLGRDASGAMKAISITPTSLGMKEYGNRVAVAAQKQALLNQLLKQGSTNLLNFGKNTQWAGRQLMVGFTIPLAYLGTAAAKTFMDLEKQAIRFKRVYGSIFTTADETNRALAEIEQLAKEFTKYGVAVVDTMKMAADAAAMGKMGAELTAQVAQATRLAVLGSVEQGQALETTISITNAFGVAADDLRRKIDFLNAVENQTVVSIEDLTIAIPKAGPVVKQLGGDVEDLAFFLTAMKEGGINASEGANALKSGLASLINPTDKASAMLAALGINIKGIVETNKGNIKNTVIAFSQALDTLAPLERSRAIEQLFGKFQFARLSTLFQNVTKDGTQAARVLELTTSSVEELAILSERELGTLEDAVGTDFKESIEQLKLSLAPIGKEFLKAITPIAKAVGVFLEKFNNLEDGTKKFIVIATTLVGLIGPTLLMTFGLLANGVANIIKLFATMRGGILRLGTNSNLLANQTQYLNTEQMEASVVAASLNQAHNRLTQSFATEAAAVRLLRQAYIDATIAATNFARANPGMMIPGAKFTPKKFASGVTKVPGSGNKDTVASMLTPGEAVIPAPVAQDPRFKPIIDAMVNGKLQSFQNGSTRVKAVENGIQFGKNEKVYPTSSSTVAQELAKILNDELKKNPPRKTLAQFEARAIDLQRRSKSITPTNLFTRFVDRSRSDARTGSGANPEIAKARSKQGYYLDPITGARLNIEGAKNRSAIEKTAQLRTILSDAGLTKPQIEKFIGGNESHLTKPGDPKTKWYEKNVIRDVKGLNNYLNRVAPSKGASTFEKLIDAAAKDRKTYGFTRYQIRQLKRDYQFVKDGNHPFTSNQMDKVKRLAQFDLKSIENGLAKEVLKGKAKSWEKNIDQAKGVKALADARKAAGGGFYKVLPSTIIQLGGDAKNPTAQLLSGAPVSKPSELGTLINKSVGRGSAIKGIDGEYSIDGKRKFVKAFANMENAQAELKAHRLNKNLFNLDTPEGRISTINHNGKQIPVVITDFDERFTEKSMKNATFRKKDIASQLIAAAVRGDTDLKTSNVSGRRAVDPGSAFVYGQSSGAKTSKLITSPEEILLRNLGLKKGTKQQPASKDFAKSTIDKITSMSPDNFDRMMQAKVKKAIKKAQKTLLKLEYTPDQRKTILARLESMAKLNYKQIHADLVVANKVAVDKNKEVMLEKGKVTKIKGVRTPSNVKTGVAGHGTMIDEQDASKVRNVGENRRAIRVRKDAPKVPMPEFRSAGQEISPLMSKQQVGALITAVNNNTKTITANNKVVGKNNTALLANTTATNNNTQDPDRNVMMAGGAPGTVNPSQTAKEAKREARAQRAQRVGAVSGPAAGALGMASMGAFMTGNTGVGMGLMGASAVASLAPMLTSPVGALVAAIAVATGGLLLYSKALKDARKEGMELAKSMSMSAEKVKQLSIISGKASASEIQARKRQNVLNPLGEEQRKFGQNVMTDPAGKQILTDVEKFVKMGFSTSKIGNILGNNLGQAVLQGAINQDQALSIASALGEELGSYDIPAKIVGNLTQLLGPNGENLEKDPLQVALAIKKESTKNLTEQFNLLQSTKKGAGSFIPSLATGGAGAAGAAIAVGSGLSATGVFAPVGATVLALAGLGVAVDSYRDFTKLKQHNAKLDAASIQLGFEAIGQSQQLLDSVNEQYDKKIKLAKTEKEINDLQAKRKIAIQNVNKANAETLNQVLKLSSGLSDNKFNTTVKESLDARFKDASAGTKALAEVAREGLEKVKDQKTRRILQIGLTSENGLSASSIIQVTSFLSNPKVDSKNIELFIQQNGFAEAETMFQAFGMMKGNAKGLDITDETKNILIKYINENDVELKDDLSALSAIANFARQYKVTLDVNTNGKEDLDLATKSLGLVQTFPDTIDKNFVLEQAGKDPKAFADFARDFEILSKGEKQISKFLYVNYQLGKSDPGLIAQAKLAYPNLSEREAVAKYIQFGFSESNFKTPVDKQVGGGGQVASSALDEVVKKLRDVQKNQIKATKGFEASMKAIKKFAKESSTTFSGIDQDIRRLGGNESLVNLILGMDPEEYEKQKGKFFEFDKKGNIKRLKQDAKDTQFALNAIALGDYNVELRSVNEGFNLQQQALKLLTDAGMDTALAYETIANKALAAAIAQGKIKPDKLKETADMAKKAAENMELFNAQTNIANKIRDYKTQKTLLFKLSSDAAKFTSQQIEAIINDKDLQTMYLQGKIDEPQFKQMLKELGDSSAVQINIKKLTLPGMEDLFNDGFSKAMESFDIKAKVIELQYETKLKIDKDSVETAQNQIAALNYQIDSLQPGLKQIENQEQKINDKYDKAAKALETIKSLNDDIARQEKARLDIASALTSGDVSAAAAAVQQFRADNAAKNIERQSQALDKAKEVELANVRSSNGLSRIQIETQIKSLQDQIFKIETETLKPAQERIRLAEVERDKLIDQITVLGKTRTEWDNIKLGIDSARIANKKYIASIQLALDLVKELIKAYAGLEPPSGSDSGSGPFSSATITPYVSDYVGTPFGQAGSKNGKKGDGGKKPTTIDRRFKPTDPSGGKTKIDKRLMPTFGNIYGAPKSNFNYTAGYTRMYGGKIIPMTYGGTTPPMNSDGRSQIAYMPFGGLIPYMKNGGFRPIGSDTVPAMLTPGEFVVNKASTKQFLPLLSMINESKYPSMIGPSYSNGGVLPSQTSINDNSTAVYNYNVGITVGGTNASPNNIAKAVMDEIKYLDKQRIRGQRVSWQLPHI